VWIYKCTSGCNAQTDQDFYIDYRVSGGAWYVGPHVAVVNAPYTVVNMNNVGATEIRIRAVSQGRYLDLPEVKVFGY
jgi:hypothetical protein